MDNSVTDVPVAPLPPTADPATSVNGRRDWLLGAVVILTITYMAILIGISMVCPPTSASWDFVNKGMDAFKEFCLMTLSGFFTAKVVGR